VAAATAYVRHPKLAQNYLLYILCFIYPSLSFEFFIQGGAGGNHTNGGGGGGGSYLHASAIWGNIAQGGSIMESGSVVIDLIQNNPHEMVISACKQTGPSGPTTAMCKPNYDMFNSSTLRFLDVNNGIQRFMAVHDTVYDVEVFGARGGDGNDNDYRYPGGYGARVAGSIGLQAGQVLNVVVGQYGGYPFGLGLNSRGGGW
jgi:hypothetical protein